MFLLKHEWRQKQLLHKLWQLWPAFSKFVMFLAVNSWEDKTDDANKFFCNEFFTKLCNTNKHYTKTNKIIEVPRKVTLWWILCSFKIKQNENDMSKLWSQIPEFHLFHVSVYSNWLSGLQGNKCYCESNEYSRQYLISNIKFTNINRNYWWKSNKIIDTRI